MMMWFDPSGFDLLVVFITQLHDDTSQHAGWYVLHLIENFLPADGPQAEKATPAKHFDCVQIESSTF